MNEKEARERAARDRAEAILENYRKALHPLNFAEIFGNITTAILDAQKEAVKTEQFFHDAIMHWELEELTPLGITDEQLENLAKFLTTYEQKAKR